MTNTNFVRATLVAALMAAPLAQAAGGNNPLHPTYFWDKANAPVILASTQDAGPTISTNPLHPSYYAAQSGVRSPFIGAAATWGPVTNPLHPQFKHH